MTEKPPGIDPGQLTVAVYMTIIVARYLPYIEQTQSVILLAVAIAVSLASGNWS